MGRGAMVAESEGRNRPETGGDSPPPPPDPAAPPPGAAAVVITVTSVEAGGSVRGVGDRKACRADSGAEQGQGKGGACVAVDLGGTDGGGWESDHGKVCRICHLSPDRGDDEPELIQLGCGCKGELGIAHRSCAEAWFRLKGNRWCEICGANAKNITGKVDSSFMEEWHEGGVLDSSRGGSVNLSSRRGGGGGCWRGQPFCNFLLACLVIAFILPWFFRINIF